MKMIVYGFAGIGVLVVSGVILYLIIVGARTIHKQARYAEERIELQPYANCIDKARSSDALSACGQYRPEWLK